METSLENQVRCARLFDEVNNARSEVINFTDHVARLEQNIQIQEGLAQNLQRQMERTGDDSFALDIQQIEDKIAELRQKLAGTQQKISRWENELRNRIEEYRNSGCDGSIGI